MNYQQKMRLGAAINEFCPSFETEGWNASTTNLLYTNTDDGGTIRGAFMSYDGMTMYVSEDDGDLKTYALNAKNDISADSTTHVSTVTLDSGLTEMIFKPDGSQVICKDEDNDRWLVYDLSTENDMTSASLAYTYETEELFLLSFNCHGTKAIGFNTSTNVLQTIIFSVPYDLRTLTVTSESNALNRSRGRQLGVSADGSKVLVGGPAGGDEYEEQYLQEYELITPWVASSCSTVGDEQILEHSGKWSRGGQISRDGLKMITCMSEDDTIYMWDITN